MFAAVSIGLYVLGLIGTNIYLIGLGISDFTLVRVRFIYTGALIAFIAFVSYPVPLIVYRGIGALDHGAKRGLSFSKALALFVAIAVPLSAIELASFRPSRDLRFFLVTLRLSLSTFSDSPLVCYCMH